MTKGSERALGQSISRSGSKGTARRLVHVRSALAPDKRHRVDNELKFIHRDFYLQRERARQLFAYIFGLINTRLSRIFT